MKRKRKLNSNEIRIFRTSKRGEVSLGSYGISSTQ